MENFVKIYNDEDYIESKRYGYDIDTAIARYPDGVPDRIISVFLGAEEKEINERYNEIVEILKGILNHE